MKINMLQVDKIVPYFRNAKRHPSEQIESLAKQIQELGFTQPLVIDNENNLVIGHGRLEAAKFLGIEKVPVTVLDKNLTKERIAALRLYDNKVSETGWDTIKLMEELSSLKDFDFDLSLTGFQDFEINSMLGIDLSDAGFDIPTETNEDEPAGKEVSEGFKQVQLLYKPEEHVKYLDFIKKYQRYYGCSDKTTAEVVLMALETACKAHEQSDEE
jgi:ParB-like chromosome segregation protein Spo0J